MAYREFHFEKIYEAPDMSILTEGLNKTAENVSTLFQSIAAAKSKKDLAADQYKVDLGKGSFENDEKLKAELAASLVNEGKEMIRSGRGFTSDYVKRLEEAKSYVANSKIQYDRWKDDLGRIDKRSTEDKYYDPQYDEDILREATHGKDNEVNFFNRGDRLQEAEKRLFSNPKAFRINDYTADYVKNLGSMEKQVTTGNPNASNSRYNKATFWDDKTGRPGVTDKHAIEYLKSRADGSVQSFIQSEVDDELGQEISKMKASNDPRTSWMKGMSDADIKNELLNNPSKNIINSQDYGIRVRNKAKEKLTNAASIDTKVSVETKKDLSRTGGLYSNDAIAHDNTFYNESVGVQNVNQKVANAHRMSQNASPGGILMISKGTTTGKPITFESGSKNIFNINSGTSQQARGSATFNLTGYQVQAYDKNGKPYMIEATDVEDLKAKIRSIPYSEFQNLDPKMSIALKGYSLNKGKMMGDIRSSTYNLNEELAKAKSSGDQQRVAQIENQLYELENFRSQLNGDADDFTDDDLLNAAARNGITAIRTDQLIRADKADLDKINTITEGLNLSKTDKWSPEMRDVASVWESRANEAVSNGYKNTRSNTKKPKTSTIPIISSQEEYMKLSSGSEYIDPNGVKRRKK